MSDKKQSGHHHVCAVRNCYIKGYNSKKKFYRFPKDVNRARIWAMKVNREDLFGKLIDLHKSYSICENHFEERMFTSHLHTRLVVTAIPTLFASLEEGTRTDHSYNAPSLQLPAKIQVLNEKVLVPTELPPVPPALFDSGLNFLDAPPTSCRQVYAVKSCSKTSDDLNLALFRFPTEPDRCKCWVEACDQRAVYNVTMSSGTMYRVCNQHFPDNMFNSPIGKIHLRPDTYPVINLEKTMPSELRSVISDISQPSLSSTADNQLDTSKGLIFQDNTKTESGQTNFGTQTQEKVANDNFGAKDDISHLCTSLSAPSVNSSETCQHLDYNENNGDSALHPTLNCKLGDDNDCVIVEDTPPLWHFNYLPETQGFMEGIGERPRRMRWFQLRSPSVT